MPSFISRLAQSQAYSPLEMIGAAVFRQSSPRFGDVQLDTDHVSGPRARNANILGLGHERQKANASENLRQEMHRR